MSAWVTLLYSRNWYNMVHQLYFNTKIINITSVWLVMLSGPKAATGGQIRACRPLPSHICNGLVPPWTELAPGLLVNSGGRKAQTPCSFQSGGSSWFYLERVGVGWGMRQASCLHQLRTCPEAGSSYESIPCVQSQLSPVTLGKLHKLSVS